MTNLVEVLDAETVARIGAKASHQKKVDEAARHEWLETHDKAMDLALQRGKKRNYPFEQAANVIYPLLTTASVQFAARALPAIIPGQNIVKAKVVGNDSGKFLTEPNPETGAPEIVEVIEEPGVKAGQAKRVADWLSFQLLELDQTWEEDTDKMLHYLPIAGCAFRKRWWDGGPRSKFISAKNLIVNMNAPSLEAAPQISERIELYPHQIEERVRAGYYDEDAVRAELGDPNSEDAEPRSIIEAHMYYDINDDGVEDPIIVTFFEDSGKVARIANNTREVIRNDDGSVRRIEPFRYYTKYGFIKNPEGGFYDIGFGTLLGPINRSINSSINQLLDAAHWQNAPSGFIGKKLRLRAGDLRLRPNEYKPVDSMGDDIRKEIVHMEFPGPSPVTFNLLSLMITSGENVASVKDILLGSSEQNLAPTTALTMVEQGTKQFTAIYKRIHSCMKRELRILMEQNRAYLDEIIEMYQDVLDDPEADASDFTDQFQMVPLTDPDMVSDQVAMAKAQFIEALAAQGRVDPGESLKYTLEVANIPDPQRFMPKQQQPDPETLIKMGKLENENRRIALATQKAEYEMLEMYTQSMKNLAEAESEEAGIQVEAYKAQVDAIGKVINELGRIRAVEGQPGNEAGPGNNRGNGGLLQGQPQGNGLPPVSSR